MAVTAELEIKVVSDKVLQAERRLDGLEKQAKKTEKATGGVAKGFGVAAVAVAGLTAATAALWSTFNNIRSAQKLNAMLKTATGSIEGAEIAMAELGATAAQMPNTLEEITSSFIKLKNLGLDPSEEALLSYGNTAAAMGKSLDQFIEAVADATTNEFERLKEFGIKSKQEGDNVKFTFQGVTTTVRKSAADIERYLQDLGNVQFAGAMAEQMATIDGQLSQLSDSWFKFTAALGESGLGDLIAKIIAAPRGVIDASTLKLKEAKFELEKATVADIPLIDAIIARNQAEREKALLQQGPAAIVAARDVEFDKELKDKRASLELDKEFLDLEKQLTEQIEKETEGRERLKKLKDQNEFIAGLTEIQRQEQITIDLLNQQFEIEQRLKDGKFKNIELEIEMLGKLQQKAEESINKEEELREKARIEEEQYHADKLQRMVDEFNKEYDLEQQRIEQAEENAKKERELRLAANKKKVEDGANLARDLASIAGVEGEKAFRINQGIAIAEATMKGAIAIQDALAHGGPFPANLGAAALIGVQTAANVATIRNQSVGSFEQGGFIGGNSFTGDNLSANVNSGEAVLNASQQRNFMRMANGGGGMGEMKVIINNNAPNTRVSAVQQSDGTLGIQVVEAAVGVVAEQLSSGNGPVALGAAQAFKRERV